MATKRINIPQDTHANLKVGDQLNIAVIRGLQLVLLGPERTASPAGCWRLDAIPQLIRIRCMGPTRRLQLGPWLSTLSPVDACTTSGVTATGHTIIVSG